MEFLTETSVYLLFSENRPPPLHSGPVYYLTMKKSFEPYFLAWNEPNIFSKHTLFSQVMCFAWSIEKRIGVCSIEHGTELWARTYDHE